MSAADEYSDLEQAWTLPVERILSDADRSSLQFAARTRRARTAFVPLALLQKELKLEGRANALLAGGVKQPPAQELAKQLELDDWGLTLLDPTDRVALLFDKIDPKRPHRYGPPSGWTLSRAASSIPLSSKTSSDFNRPSGRVCSRRRSVKAMRPRIEDTPTRAEVEAYYLRERAYLTLESRQLFLEPAVVEAAEKAATDKDLVFSPSLVYLANAIDSAPHDAIRQPPTGYPTPRIPYSVIAAVEPSYLPPGFQNLGDKQIFLAKWSEWDEPPFRVRADDSITLRYFPPEHHGEPQERSETFQVAASSLWKASPATPTSRRSFRASPTSAASRTGRTCPFPTKAGASASATSDTGTSIARPRKRTSAWRRAQRLWGTRFGKVTSIRLTAKEDVDLSEAADALPLEIAPHTCRRRRAASSSTTSSPSR